MAAGKEGTLRAIRMNSHGLTCNHQGISLTIDQYKALLAAVPKVNDTLRGLGVDLAEAELGTSEPESKLQKGPPAIKATKSNIDTTSDEDEG